MTTTIPSDPLTFLRELLEEDRDNGLSWDELCFRQVVGVVCRVAPAGASWHTPIIETAEVWHDAYDRKPGGALEQLSADLGHDESDERSDVFVV